MRTAQPNFLRAGAELVPLLRIARADTRDLATEGAMTITDLDGRNYRLSGPDAIEAVLLLKPSITEGLRLGWQKRAWAVHNLIGHPGMQLLAWLGFAKLGIALHDRTIPRPPKARG